MAYTSELRKRLVAHAKKAPVENWRADADAINFARMVEHVYTETYDIQYPELDMANGEVLPVDTSVPAGAQTYTYYTYGGTGVAAIVNTYAKNSIPRVGYAGKSTTGKVVSLALMHAWNIEDLEAAQMSGVPLENGLAEANKRGHMIRRHDIGWFGSPADGIVGLLNHPNIIRAKATTLWSGATFDQINADMNTLLNTSSNLTNNIERPDTVYLPHTVWNDLSWRLVNTANPNEKTILAWLQSNYPNVTFKMSTALAIANHPLTEFAGLNVAVAFNRSKNKASLIVPKDFTLLPPQWDGLESQTFSHSKVGGAKIPYPFSVVVMTGL